ncbi:MAG: AAA family ATPase [Lachnospiraceae bacterium]|jgi:uncharacterized protein YhaN|nr:AAA family ATPase [Lachnospiraceae bacterium]
MRLLTLHIDGFGKFHDFSMSFDGGLNVIYGKNEAGKSTIHTFIRSMFFGLEPKSGVPDPDDYYNIYQPWEDGEVYGGSLRVENAGKTYRLERTFLQPRPSFRIFNETDGHDEADAPGTLKNILCGLTKISYDNTVSIKQLKSVTESEMAQELRRYLSNVNTTGNSALNASGAITFLEHQKQAFEIMVVPEAAKTYAGLISETRKLETEISSPKYENRLGPAQKKADETRRRAEEKGKEKEELARENDRSERLLEQNKFVDAESITSYGAQINQLYEDYQVLRHQSEGKAGPVFSVLSLIIGIIVMVGDAALFLLTSLGVLRLGPLLSAVLADTSAYLVLGGIGAAFLVLCIILRIWVGSRKKEAALTAHVLEEIFFRHLGDSEISPAALQAMDERIEGFHRTYDSIGVNEKAMERLSEELVSLAQEQESDKRALHYQQEIRQELEERLVRLASLQQQIQVSRNALTENERLLTEIDSIDLATETLVALSEMIKNSFGPHLNAAASNLVREISGGVYQRISIDEQLNIYLYTKDRTVPITRISSGALDQVYLGLRLASARLIENGADRLPLILDDSFVLYDDERLGNAINCLVAGYGGQIILFSCHHREKLFLDEAGVRYRYIDLG